MLFKNLGFVVSILLLLVALIRAGDNTTEKKLTRRCKDNERRALLEFKAGVVDYYGMLSTWGSNSNEEECCIWRGIRCSNRNGHVILINLPGNIYAYTDSDSVLTGKISPSLSELKHLKYLNLGNNAFVGEIPPQLGNLTNLRSLDLGGDYYMEAQNLEWLSRLHLLTYLDLSSVDLSNCSGWLNHIYKLSSLTHLHLAWCHLPDQFGHINNTFFPGLNSLVVVDLSYNDLISSKSYNWLYNFTTTLVDLDLSNNLFPRNGIPEGFGRILSLESLIIWQCGLEGMLPDSFGNLSRLATLDLRYNNFNVSLPEFLHPFSTKENNSIQVLYLNNNQLTGCLPDYFTKFTSIRELLISDNKLSGTFPDNHWQLSSTLAHLDLSHNQITGSLPNLTLLSSLETLVLGNNSLEGIVPVAYLSNLSKLTVLDLTSNSLSLNFSFDWFPPFQLDILLLRNCTLGPRFPNWITSQSNISELDISHARISDTIPLHFWNLSPHLKKLNMSNNHIQGIIPNISLNFPNIVYIDLSNNLLQGLIPSFPLSLDLLDLSNNMFTGSLSVIYTSPYEQLQYLDLSNNKLSGELSNDCLMNIRTLSILDLANNDFYGIIPTSIGLLDRLTTLQLRNNNFTGQLPLSMMNFTNLVLLDLSGNRLSGKVPPWIGTHLESLVVLSLRDNEFSGSIPLQICHMREAQVLDLSQNNLTGSIPHCINNFTSLVDKETTNYLDGTIFFQGDLTIRYDDRYENIMVQWKRVLSEYGRTLEYLKLIDLSSNRLVGEIPKEFESLKRLISLNLSSNSLIGNIIPNIGQMENLENLDLSGNHLSGKIPSGITNLTLLSVLDLRNNNLKGKIPKSTQLQSFDPSSYAGNEQLCGLPLPKNCGGGHSIPTGHDDRDMSNEADDDNFPKFWLYTSAALGFGIGFWGFIGPLMLRRTWRHSYYKLMGDIADRIYIQTILKMTGLQRKFTINRSNRI